MPIAEAWAAGAAEQLIAAEIASARAFYGEDGGGATALLPILHALQHRFGFVAPEAVPLIADRLNISNAEVRGVISFYADFRQARRAHHVLKLCRAEACQAQGSERIAAHLASAHALRPDVTTGRVRLENVYCLGNCALGPAAMVDNALMARFNERAADRLMARLDETSA